MNQTMDTVNAIVRSLAGPNKVISPAKQLVEDLGFDSLKLFELVAAVEDEFSVLIPVSRVAHIKTVADLYAALEGIDHRALEKEPA